MSKNKIIFLFSILLSLISINHYAYITATLQDDNYNQGNYTSEDIIDLVLTSDSDDINNIDLSPLKKDFQVTSQAKQVSHTIINGQSSSKIQIVVSLMAKKYGKLTIPSLILNNESTAPITISVKDLSLDPNYKQEVFINLEASDSSVYVNAPLRLNINIYLSNDITVRNLQLNSEESKDYNLFKLNENNKQIFHENKRYTLYNVQYLAFFNKDGKQLLPKFTLSGVKLKSNPNSQDIFSLYQQQWVPFNRSNATIPVEVKPAAANLTADDLSISQQWSTDSANLQVGEAIQRVITISGVNIPAESLPVLYNPDTDSTSNNSNYKIYVDKPEVENTISNGQLLSSLTQKITYITTKSGDFIADSHVIKYFNNNAKSIKSIELNKKIFNITQATVNPENKSNNSINAQDTTKTINKPNNTPVNKINITDSSKNSLNSNLEATNKNLTITNDAANLYSSYKNTIFYVLITIIFILVIIIISLLIIIKSPSARSDTKTKKSILKQSDNYYQLNKSSITAYINKLKLAASKGNAESSYQILLNMAENIFNHDSSHINSINSISKLKQHLPKEHQDNINELLSSLYGINKTAWDNQFFCDQIIPAIKEIVEKFYEQSLNQPNSQNNTSSTLSVSELYPD